MPDVLRRVILVGMFLAAALAVPATAAAQPGCGDTIQPLNPFVQTCGIPNAPPVVPGASPGAGAIIACRGIPGCLSYVVNGGPGYSTAPGFRIGNGR